MMKKIDEIISEITDRPADINELPLRNIDN
jgi:hypothetical protein